MSSAGPSSGGVPPRNYVCKRCLIPGHFYQDCPVKDSMATRTTGIPRSFLTPANPNDPGAKVNPQVRLLDVTTDITYLFRIDELLVRFDLTLKKLLQWLVSNHVPVTLPPRA